MFFGYSLKIDKVDVNFYDPLKSNPNVCHGNIKNLFRDRIFYFNYLIEEDIVIFKSNDQDDGTLTVKVKSLDNLITAIKIVKTEIQKMKLKLK
jgi:hypothetical protein